MRKSVGSWLTATVLVCLGVVAASPRLVSAQALGVASPGWDYKDPVNVIEAREYARLWFAFKDTGVVSPEFQAFRFTNPAPQGVMTPFYGAELLFEKLYAHRLQAWPDGTPGMYGLTELRRDDPAVEAAFRLYATEGKFTTPLDDDATLVIGHLTAIVDAGEAATEFEFVEGQQIAVVDGGLESTGLLVKEGIGGEPVTTTAIGTDTVAETIRTTYLGFRPGTRPIGRTMKRRVPQERRMTESTRTMDSASRPAIRASIAMIGSGRGRPT